MMKIYKTDSGIVVLEKGNCYLSPQQNWDAYINRDSLHRSVMEEITALKPVGDEHWLDSRAILAPVGSQEVWAAGVTYLRSKTARMEESKESGGATFYDKVYDAERPELFFKSTAARVVGPGQKVRIRKDSTWNVPEPELTLFISSSGKVQAYTIGNDMSSRSIEGENPLYLPQAKTYDGSAALGPCLLVMEEEIPASTMIEMSIQREQETVFEGKIEISQMKRSHEELVGFLFRECSFPHGCFLMTGTCVVPGNEFTLSKGDAIHITIEQIGTLINVVE